MGGHGKVFEPEEITAAVRVASVAVGLVKEGFALVLSGANGAGEETKHAFLLGANAAAVIAAGAAICGAELSLDFAELLQAQGRDIHARFGEMSC